MEVFTRWRRYSGWFCLCFLVFSVVGRGDISQYYGPPELIVYSYSQTVFTNETHAFVEGSYNKYTDHISWTNGLDGMSGVISGLSTVDRYWSLWLPLSEGTNVYTLCAVNKTGQTACVSVVLDKVIGKPVLTVENSLLEFEGVVGAPNPMGQSFSVKNSGSKILNYTVQPLDSWLLCTETNGSLVEAAFSTYTVTPNTSGFSEGYRQGNIRIASNGGTQDVCVAVSMRKPSFQWTGEGADDAWDSLYNWCDLVVPDDPGCDVTFTGNVSSAAFPYLTQQREIGTLTVGGDYGHSLYFDGAPLLVGDAAAGGILLDFRPTDAPQVCGFSNRVQFARAGEWRVTGLQELMFLDGLSVDSTQAVTVSGGGRVLLGGRSVTHCLGGGIDVLSGVLAVEGTVDCGENGIVRVHKDCTLQISGQSGDTITEAIISNAAPGSVMVDLEGTLLLNADGDGHDIVRCDSGVVALGSHAVVCLDDRGIVDTSTFTFMNALAVSGQFEYVEFPYSHVLNYTANTLQASPRRPWTGAGGNNAWNSSFNWVIPGNQIPSADTPLMIGAVYHPTPHIQSNGQARSVSFFGNGQVQINGNAGSWLTLTNAPYGEPFVEVYANAQVEMNTELRIPEKGYFRLHENSVLRLNRNVGEPQVQALEMKGEGTCFVNAELFADGVRVDGGILSGTGFVHGRTVVEAGGALEPGSGVGTITFTDLEIAGRCRVELDGATADRIVVESNLVLSAGSLLQGSDTGESSSEYVLLNYRTRSGMFGSYSGFSGQRRLRYETDCIRCVTVTGGTQKLLTGAWTRTLEIPVTAGPDEVWFCEADDSWITMQSGVFGVGCQTAVVAIARNTELTERTGTFVIAGKEYTVTQYGLIRVRNDFDGDGISDIGCYYPLQGYWYINRSSLGLLVTQFGYADTYPVTGDFDGDGLCDYGFYYPPKGLWQIMKSRDGQWTTQFGFGGTVPVTGDFDGDGITDFGCYLAEKGLWYIYKSSSGFWMNNFGYAGTVPVTGDFDGDGRCDFGCYYPPRGYWYVYRSMDGLWLNSFGYEGTIPVTGDFDADGKGDFGCYFPPEGYWYIYKSRTGLAVNKFGYTGTLPITGNYDGDEQCDFGCYYPPQGYWYVYGNLDGLSVKQFGYAGTIPIGLY